MDGGQPYDVIRVRVSIEQKVQFAEAAKQEGLDVSTWLRMIGIARINRIAERLAAISMGASVAEEADGMKINIIGYAGEGKTMLANFLQEKLASIGIDSSLEDNDGSDPTRRKRDKVRADILKRTLSRPSVEIETVPRSKGGKPTTYKRAAGGGGGVPAAKKGKTKKGRMKSTARKDKAKTLAATSRISPFPPGFTKFGKPIGKGWFAVPFEPGYDKMEEYGSIEDGPIPGEM